jgi:hypothetical protein
VVSHVCEWQVFAGFVAWTGLEPSPGRSRRVTIVTPTSGGTSPATAAPASGTAATTPVPAHPAIRAVSTEDFITALKTVGVVRFSNARLKGGGGSSSEQVPETCESAWSLSDARGGEVGCSMQSTPPCECAPSSPLHVRRCGRLVVTPTATARAKLCSNLGPAAEPEAALARLVVAQVRQVRCLVYRARVDWIVDVRWGALLRHAQGPVFPARLVPRGTLSPSTRGCLNLPPENTKPRCHQAFHPCFLLLVSQT